MRTASPHRISLPNPCARRPRREGLRAGDGDARAGREAQAAGGGSRPAGDTPVSETVEVGGTPGEEESRKAAVDKGQASGLPEEAVLSRGWWQSLQGVDGAPGGAGGTWRRETCENSASPEREW